MAVLCPRISAKFILQLQGPPSDTPHSPQFENHFGAFCKAQFLTLSLEEAGLVVFWDAVTGSEVARLPAHEEILVNCHCLAVLNGTSGRSMLICMKTWNREAQERHVFLHVSPMNEHARYVLMMIYDL